MAIRSPADLAFSAVGEVGAVMTLWRMDENPTEHLCLGGLPEQQGGAAATNLVPADTAYGRLPRPPAVDLPPPSASESAFRLRFVEDAYLKVFRGEFYAAWHQTSTSLTVTAVLCDDGSKERRKLLRMLRSDGPVIGLKIAIEDKGSESFAEMGIGGGPDCNTFLVSLNEQQKNAIGHRVLHLFIRSNGHELNGNMLNSSLGHLFSAYKGTGQWEEFLDASIVFADLAFNARNGSDEIDSRLDMVETGLIETNHPLEALIVRKGIASRKASSVGADHPSKSEADKENLPTAPENQEGKVCGACGELGTKEAFSKKQWKFKSWRRRCIDCVDKDCPISRSEPPPLPPREGLEAPQSLAPASVNVEANSRMLSLKDGGTDLRYPFYYLESGKFSCPDVLERYQVVSANTELGIFGALQEKLLVMALVTRTVPDETTAVISIPNPSNRQLEHSHAKRLVVTLKKGFCSFLSMEVDAALAKALREADGQDGDECIHTFTSFDDEFGPDHLPPLWPQAPLWPIEPKVKADVLSRLNTPSGQGFGEMVEELVFAAEQQRKIDDDNVNCARKCHECFRPCQSRCMCGEAFCSKACQKRNWDLRPVGHRRICQLVFDNQRLGHVMAKVEMATSLTEVEYDAAFGRA